MVSTGWPIIIGLYFEWNWIIIVVSDNYTKLNQAMYDANTSCGDIRWQAGDINDAMLVIWTEIRNIPRVSSGEIKLSPKRHARTRRQEIEKMKKKLQRMVAICDRCYENLEKLEKLSDEYTP